MKRIIGSCFVVVLLGVASFGDVVQHQVTRDRQLQHKSLRTLFDVSVKKDPLFHGRIEVIILVPNAKTNGFGGVSLSVQQGEKCLLLANLSTFLQTNGTEKIYVQLHESIITNSFVNLSFCRDCVLPDGPSNIDDYIVDIGSYIHEEKEPSNKTK